MIDAGDPFLDDDQVLSPSDAAAAILIAPGRRYLLQLRDDKPGIFYPGHWGCFGGAIESTDSSVEACLRREIAEEIGIELRLDSLVYFTAMNFDLHFAGLGVLRRSYFEAPLDARQIARIRLGEGSQFLLFTAREALSLSRLTPYDAFALWLHANRGRVRPGKAASDDR
jgi:8-oxo-dGTP pyrophosphatase MutT (NUDIX family)